MRNRHNLAPTNGLSNGPPNEANHALKSALRSLSTTEFYRKSLHLLADQGVPFLVGGAFALQAYTGIQRATKDIDIFVRPQDCVHTLEVFAQAGYDTELTDPLWLAKAHCDEHLVDIIFNGANSLSEVTDTWFEHARRAKVAGVHVLLCPPEETILSKSYIMERDRFDGHDVVHYLRVCAPQLEWHRLLTNFGPHWRILLMHVVLFGFVYPSERARIPRWVVEELLARLHAEGPGDGPLERLCQGTLISRVQYETDVKRWGYRDARLVLAARAIDAVAAPKQLPR